MRARLLLLLLLPACYTYRPLSRPEPAAGERVSAELTDEGSRRLAAQVGPDVEHLEGRVVAVDSAALELAVAEVETSRGIQSDWNGERVRIPRSEIAGLQARRLSVGGTGLIGGLTLGAMYVAYRLFGGDGIFEGNPGGGGGSAR